MIRRPSPRRSLRAAVLLTSAVFGFPVLVSSLRAQDPLPGTPDESFSIVRVRTSFYLPAQVNFTPFALALQPGEDPVSIFSPGVREVPAAQTKLIVGGDGATLFRSFLTRTVRITSTYNADGVVETVYSAPFQPGDIDPSFLASPNGGNGIGDAGRTVYSLFVNADHSILAGGLFGRTLLEDSVFDDQEKNFVRLNFNGDPELANVVDANGNITGVTQGTFNANVGAGANDSVLAILRRSVVVPGENEGRLLLGGQFIRFNRQNRGRIVQLLPDGSGDQTFNDNLGSGANGIVYSLAEAVDPSTGLANGQIYVCGDFDSFNGKGPGKLVRLNADGTLDATFAPRIRGRTIAVAVQPDGRVLVGGDIDSVNGTGITNVTRLNPDGSLDPVFAANARVTDATSQSIPPTAVYVLRVQPDGRIIVGGNYLRINGEPRRYLGRLNADGTLDTTFAAINPVTGNPVLSQATQSVVFIPRDSDQGNGLDLVYSQTRADRKEVPGDDGYFPTPVRRLSGDGPAGNLANFPTGISQVRIVAEGPRATVGDLRPTTDPNLINQPVPNPGTPGLFRITREGDLTRELSISVKVTNAAGLNQNYVLRQLLISTDAATTVVSTTPSGPLEASFPVVIPANESSVSIIVQGRQDTRSQNDERVTLKVRDSTDGSYVKRTGRVKATVTVLANNL